MPATTSRHGKQVDDPDAGCHQPREAAEIPLPLPLFQAHDGDTDTARSPVPLAVPGIPS